VAAHGQDCNSREYRLMMKMMMSLERRKVGYTTTYTGGHEGRQGEKNNDFMIDTNITLSFGGGV